MLYLVRETPEAAPKRISGRTSYSRASLAFHSLPQLVRGFCTTHRFGLPGRFPFPSPWPGQARSASGLAPAPSGLFTLAFTLPPEVFASLDLAQTRTRWLLLQKVRCQGVFLPSSSL